MQTDSKDPGRTRHCIRSNQPYLERGHSSAYGSEGRTCPRGRKDKQCADDRIARNGQGQALGPELAFPHLGNQFVTNLGEFFYLFILKMKDKKRGVLGV